MGSNRIFHVRGDSLDAEVEVIDEDDEPYPLNNVKIILRVTDYYSGNILIIRKNDLVGGDDSQIEVTNINGGIFEFHILSSQTKNLHPTDYRYDIKIYKGSKVYTIINDLFTVQRDALR